MEGKYWKRRIGIVAIEYQRWRRFNRDRIRHRFDNSHGSNGVEFMDITVDPGADTESKNLRLEQDDAFMEMFDNLDFFLDEPLTVSPSRELGNFYNADFVQPGLLPLQPMLEELSVDVVQAILQTPASVASTSLPIGGGIAGSSPREPPRWQPQTSQRSGYLTSLLTQPVLSLDSLSDNRSTVPVSQNTRENDLYVCVI